MAAALLFVAGARDARRNAAMASYHTVDPFHWHWRFFNRLRVAVARNCLG